MKCMTMECHGNYSVSSGWAPEPEQSLRKKKKEVASRTKNKTEKMKTVSADFWLSDLRGEGGKTQRWDMAPKCGGINWRNI